MGKATEEGMMKGRGATSIDFDKVVSIGSMKGDEEDTSLLRGMAAEAAEYLSSQEWCGQIEESFFGLGVGGLVAVFLFKIVPSQKGVDEYNWVIVGDLPPLYITTEEAPNPACALDSYIGAMEAWVEAAVSGNSTEGLPPVSAAPTRENGLALRGRLEFLDENILHQYHDDLA